jgi:hypothetical protein
MADENLPPYLRVVDNSLQIDIPLFLKLHNIPVTEENKDIATEACSELFKELYPGMPQRVHRASDN